MSDRGFTLLEVMISLAILGLALSAIVDINATTIRTHAYAKQVTVATMLARSKMADLESQFIEEGFTSEFDQTMEGDFDDEGWEGFRWSAEIVTPDLDAANATALIEQVMQRFLSPTQDPGASAGPAPADPTMVAAGGMLEAVRPMIQTQMQQLVEILKRSLREVRLKVIWEDGGQEESIDVTTHMVVLAPAGQPGGASNDPQYVGAQDAATSGNPLSTPGPLVPPPPKPPGPR